ncbi:MutS-related protein [Trinickia dinghuensis]|uniref:DNA mismatch repair protein MutS n=1 Tax=Trinickia dinghuensis TaxID=2291023 RepID=A0A3D8JY63_9BURK|nr:DNA mismatch repair protein MutS [Trinickia dinghuensis]RDU97820.1 DNA mismatch repair protein MutS [Trinickia dinghuensis]
MTFHSILFETPEDRPSGNQAGEPDFFGDLNLDQMVAEATRGYAEYDLASFFYTPLSRVGAIVYRHEIMRDLENPVVHDSVKLLTDGMRKMRALRAEGEKLYYSLQKQWWFLESTIAYSMTLGTFARELHACEPRSKGFREFLQHLTSYLASEAFQALVRDADDVKRELASIQYCTLVKGSTVTVRRYDSESDYSAKVLGIFDRFKLGATKERCEAVREQPQMNHVEAQVLQFVARLSPQPFSKLAAFHEQHADYLDATIATFDREIQFYLAYGAYVGPCREQGLEFSYPLVTDTSKAAHCDETYDLVLAHKLATDNARVVCNGLHLNEGEHLLIVSGPNNGGKTTFARMFGQLHYLTRLGCPVPGHNARLFLCNALFTHFEREESTKDMRGKLRDDLYRMHGILTQATSDSVIIMNEIFSSTTLADALFLSKRIIGQIIELGALCVCVTFIEELARLSGEAVSMVSEIDPAAPEIRTYRIRRRDAGSEAYAMSIARHYGLTYDRLKERLGL